MEPKKTDRERQEEVRRVQAQMRASVEGLEVLAQEHMARIAYMRLMNKLGVGRQGPQHRVEF